MLNGVSHVLLLHNS